MRISKLVFPLLVLLALLLGGACKKQSEGKVDPKPAVIPPDQDQALVDEAKKFFADADKELRKLNVDSSLADWANQTDITPEHEAAAAKGTEELAKGITRLIKASRKFEAVEAKLDPETARQLRLLKFAGQPAPDDAK